MAFKICALCVYICTPFPHFFIYTIWSPCILNLSLSGNKKPQRRWRLLLTFLLPDPAVSGCQSTHLMPGQPTIILKSEHSWLCITDTEAIILKLACIRELNCSLSKAVGLGKGHSRHKSANSQKSCSDSEPVFNMKKVSKGHSFEIKWWDQ